MPDPNTPNISGTPDPAVLTSQNTSTDTPSTVKGQNTSATTTPAPNLNLTQPSASNPTSMPKAIPVPIAVPPPPNVVKDTMLGQLARSLLSGTQGYSTQVNPQTGQTEQVPIKSKPGALMRHIVAGAMMGIAAGSQEHDALGGVGKGAATVMNYNAQQQERQAASGQQGFQNQRALVKDQQEQSRIDNESMMSKATIAFQNAEVLKWDGDANLRSQEDLDKTNEEQQSLQKWVVDSGGQLFDAKGNGMAGSGTDLMKAYNSGQIKAPKGYELVLTSRVDTSGVKYTNKDGYVDSETGKPVDLKDRTSYSVYQVPIQTMSKTILVKGSTLSSTYGVKGLDPNQDYPLQLRDLFGLAEKDMGERRQFAHDELMNTQKNQQMVLEGLNEELDAAKSEYDKEVGLKENADPARIQAAEERQNGIIDQMNTVIGEMNPHLRPQPVPKPSGQDPIKWSTVAPDQAVIERNGIRRIVPRSQLAGALEDKAVTEVPRPSSNSVSNAPTKKGFTPTTKQQEALDNSKKAASAVIKFLTPNPASIGDLDQ